MTTANRTTWRRAATATATLAVAAGALVVGAPPAHAAIESPSAGAVVRDHPTVSGRQGTERNRSVDRVTVTLTPPDGGTPVSILGCSGASCGGTAGTFSASFSVPVNGTYTAVAVAQHDGGGALDPADSGRSAPVSFAVEIAPEAPRRLVAEPNGARRTITLSWTPNTEADLVGYQVLRGVDGSTPEPHGSPVGADTTTFVDDAGDGGRFTYQVVAIRRGATANTIVASDASNEATATVDRVAPPTTAATTSDASSGGSASPSGGTGGTAPGGTGDGTGDAARNDGGLRTSAAAAPVRITPGARLDLSGFTPNTVPLNLGPAPAPDTGFQPTLPYDLRARATEEPEAAVDEPADEPALPVGSLVTTTTESNRKTLLTFLAGAMLLFMLSMHLRWLLRRTAPVTG